MRSKGRVRTGVCREQLKTSKSDRNSDTHNKGHKCHYCEKAFQHKRSLVVHIRTHTGEKPFGCQSCPKKFADKSALVMHTRTHTGEKPYKCEYCGKKFSQSLSLRNHTRTHTGEKPFECRICDYSGAAQSYLITHERTHAKEKPFKCQFCNFATKFPSNLKVHEQRHAAGSQDVRKKQKYKCFLCPKIYFALPSLRYHKKTHTEKKQHTCTFCAYSAIQRSAVARHAQRWHTLNILKPNQHNRRSKITKQGNHSGQKQRVRGVQQRFNSATTLERWNPEETFPSQCKACKFLADSYADLALHMSALHQLPVVQLRRIKQAPSA